MSQNMPNDGAELFVALLEKNNLIADHSRRVSLLSALIGQALGLNAVESRELRLGGLLHDIGKLSVSQKVLGKPGRLNENEFAQIKTHPALGGHFVDAVGYPNAIVDMVKHHHERLDGSGYPFGLQGEQITLASRVIAVADVYEAMTADRPYRKALTAKEAFDELAQPSKYDQGIVQAFKKAISTIDLSEFHDLALATGIIVDANLKEKVLV